MTTSWIETTCALCGGSAVRPILEVPHPEAPDGRSVIGACTGCGLRRLTPRPGPDSIDAYYAAATGYNAYVGRRRSPRAQRLWNFLRDGAAAPSGQGVVGRLLRPLTGPTSRWLFDINVPLDGRRGLRVIEVGSGFGDILIYLKSRGCEVLGTDLSRAGAEKAREYGVEVRVGNLAELGLPAESFDAAILCHSLEHVPNPNVELAELARLLTPGGQIHIAVPNGNAVRLRLDGTAWPHLSHPLHFWFFDAASLTRLLERHGFRLTGPPRTTTRHHAFNTWRYEGRHRSWILATRRFVGFLRATAATPDGGDVLRVIAEKFSVPGMKERWPGQPANTR